MKKNTLTLVIFLLAGLLVGSIIGDLLSGVSWLSFLTMSKQIVWEPRGDFLVVKYDLSFQVKLNLISILGLAAAIWLYRKL